MSLVFRSMKMLLSYKGFQINDEKAFLKCIFSILSDYLHQRGGQQQTSVFHHLAEGIPYTLHRRPRSPTEEVRKSCEDSDEAGERCQSSLSSVKILEPHEACEYSEDLMTISFDLTSLSNYCSFDCHDNVIFLETRSIYPINSDISVKFIYHSSGSESSPSPSSSNCNNVNQKESDSIDRVEIHLYSQDDNRSTNDSQKSVIIASQSVEQEINESGKLMFASLSFSASMLSQVEIGQSYCFHYVDSNGTCLGQSSLFTFQNSSHLEEIRTDSLTDSEEDGFVIVDPNDGLLSTSFCS